MNRGEVGYRPFRNQQVGGSIPLAGTSRNNDLGEQTNSDCDALGTPVGTPAHAVTVASP
jgi:hypothetical protein